MSQYTDPRVVALYDALNPPDASHELFAQLVGTPPRRVLDVGTGTGQLAIRLAAAGHTVTAIDPAAPMLDIARRNDGDRRVEWLVADARSCELPGRYDAVLMTGHVFQVFLADDDIAAVLANARRHVVAGGVLAFDSRNPAARAWQRWTPEHSRRTLSVEPFGTVTIHHEVLEVAGDLVRFATHHELGDERQLIVTESTLRFLDAGELVARVRAAGFATNDVYGDWDRSPVSAGGPELIVVAS